jgi:carboxymethylenebutenolidase
VNETVSRAEINRRQLLRLGAGGALAAGFALAARPIAAGTIVTPEKGLTAGEVDVPIKGGKMRAYRAHPESGGPFPIVLVVHEIFGVHEYVRDVCRRLAQTGYLAVAPDLFSRQGDPTKLADVGEIMTKVVAKVPDRQVLSDLDASLAWSRGSGKGDVSRVGITGFCWGGRIVWLYCDYNPTLKAGVAWYGRLTGASSDLTPKFPLDVAASLRVPILGLYGGADAGIPLETVERMRSALAAAGGTSEIVVYDGAPHGFHADYRESYRKEAAEDGWRRLVEWLHRHGVG